MADTVVVLSPVAGAQVNSPSAKVTELVEVWRYLYRAPSNCTAGGFSAVSTHCSPIQRLAGTPRSRRAKVRWPSSRVSQA